MKIGLLEDNQMICDLITTTLELVGHTVVSYTYGISLLDVLLTAHDSSSSLSSLYDLLIVDLCLPGELSGLAVINRLHESSEPFTLPLVIVSGTGQRELDAIHERYSTIAILRKPFSIKALVATVDEQYYTVQKKLA